MVGSGRWIPVVPLVCLGVMGGVRAESPGWYGSAGVGAAYSDSGALESAGGGNRHDTVYLDVGRPIGSLAVGVGARDLWRFELDLSYRFNEAEVLYGGAGPDLEPDADSSLSARSLGLNAVYQPDLGLGVRPYVGTGVGHARVSYEINEYATGETLMDDSDSVLAWQVVAGFGMRLTRHLDLLADYRYWQAADLSLEAADGTAVETGYRLHSTMVSLRYLPFATPPPGGAREVDRNPGWYVRAQGGMSFAKDSEIEDSLENFDAFDLGEVASIAIGRTVGRRWRVEIEGIHSSHPVEIVDFSPRVGEERADGRVRARSAMANVLFEPEWNLTFRPYGGLGIGSAWSDWRVRLDADDHTYLDDGDSTWAAQLMVGAAARLSPRLQLTGEFRYWITGLLDMAQPDGQPLRTEQTINSLMLGVRYTLH